MVELREVEMRGRLEPLTLRLVPGVTALLGGNGAGKSTLLALIAGRLRSPTGAVTIAGEPLATPAAAALRADVPQQVAFPTRARVSELLGVARATRAVSAAAVAEAVGRMGLGSLLARPAGRLSGGERQRVALACALMGAPPLWLLDEPAASLDREGLSRLAAWVRDHAAAGGTVLVGAHRDEEVRAYAPNRLLRLAGGVLVADLLAPGVEPGRAAPGAGVDWAP
jgi:ABC-2 type transport system ATP-binding protein